MFIAFPRRISATARFGYNPVVLRRAFIVSLVLAALGVSLVGCLSCYAYQMSILRVTGRHWLVVHMGDGLMRVLWASSLVDKVDLFPSPSRRYARVRFDEGEDTPWPRFIRRGGPYGISLARRGPIAPFGAMWRRPVVPAIEPGGSPVIQVSMVRFPAVVPVAMLLVFPLTAYLRGPWLRRRRMRRGQCPDCGYDLQGLTEPRCPECGRTTRLGEPNQEPIPIARCGTGL